MQDTTTSSAPETVAAPAPPGGPQAAPLDPSTMDPYALAMAAFEDAGGNDRDTTPGDAEAEPSSPIEAPAPEPVSVPATTPASPPPAPPETPAPTPETSSESRVSSLETARASGLDALPEVRRHIGLDAVYEGGPTYDHLADLIERRDYQGLAQLRRADGSYGYSLEEAIDVRRELNGRRAILGQQVGVAHQTAWSAIGAAFDGVAKEAGLDPDQLSAGAPKGADALGVTRYYLDQIRAAERKAAQKEYKGRIDALETELKAARTGIAASTEPLERGGSGRLNGAAAVLKLADSDPDAFVERALRGEFEGVDMSDR